MRWSLFFILICIIHSAFSQKINVEYRIDELNKITKNPKSSFKDSSELFDYLVELQKLAWKENYIEFSIDSVVLINDHHIISGQSGTDYESVVLSVDETELDFLKRKLQTKKGKYTISQLTSKNINKHIQEISQIYLENGYPFCALSINKLKIENYSFVGQLDIDKGPLVKWNKINVRGDSSLNPKFISSLINIKEGDIYNEKLFTKISTVINNTPYLTERGTPEILFTKEGAELFIYIDNVPRSSVNGIVGFQPDPVSGKVNFTGDVRLRLMNVLKHGEKLNLTWQSVAKQTQSLSSSISYPYLFNTPFGISGEFNLYKRDSSFLETDASFGVAYNLTPSWNIQVLYSRNSSNLLNGTFSTDEQRGTVKTNLYGLASENTSVDYLPNPSKGYYFNARIQGGVRSFRRNDSIAPEKDQTLRSTLNIGTYIPMFPRHVLHLENQTSFYYAEEIFSNELYRFGGLLEQRGFNEDELLASARSTFTLEYRFLLDRNSNVFAFFDVSWYERKTVNYLNDVPFGTGLGFSFSSNVGVFNLAYAIGQQMNSGFQLSNSKIHFGYSAVF